MKNKRNFSTNTMAIPFSKTQDSLAFTNNVCTIKYDTPRLLCTAMVLQFPQTLFDGIIQSVTCGTKMHRTCKWTEQNNAKFIDYVSATRFLSPTFDLKIIHCVLCTCLVEVLNGAAKFSLRIGKGHNEIPLIFSSHYGSAFLLHFIHPHDTSLRVSKAFRVEARMIKLRDE